MNIFPYTAALLHLAGYVTYSIQTAENKAKPNPTSWFVWALLGTANAITFSSLTTKLNAFQAIVASAGSIIIFLQAWKLNSLRKTRSEKGRVSAEKITEWCIVAGSITALIVLIHNPLHASLIITGAAVLSFWPTYFSTWHSPARERFLPWFLWSSAYLATAASTHFTLDSSSGWELAMPVTNAVLHSAVPTIAALRRNKLGTGTTTKDIRSA